VTENPHDVQQARATRATGWQGLACLAALAAVTLAGCSTSAGSTAVHASSGTPAPSISTVPATTVVVAPAANGPATFRSPSGNINCTLSTPGGDITARCEVVNHTWVAAPPPDCHLDSGDRFYLTQGGSAIVGCYGQEFGPAPQQTLGYGQSWSFGTLTCVSEYTGMTCTDSSTGHYFRVSRDDYELG
jgi:hypothetical protein